MSIAAHLIVAILYAVVAALIAFGLPRFAPGVGAWTAGAFGLAVFVCCGLLHEMLSRQRSYRRLVRRMNLLRKAYNQNKDDLSRARDEVRRIYEALERAGHMGPDADGVGIREVAAEVKVLHSLVEQLYSDQGSDAEVRERILSVDARPEERSAAAVHLASVTAQKFRAVNALDEGAVIDIVRDGLRQDRIDLYLQPIVSLPQRKKRYFECFSRIRAADGTMILPEQYIDIAKQNDLITAIDNMLLFRCVQLLRKTQRQNYSTAFFCNVSPHTIADRSFFPEFIEYLENCKQPAVKELRELSQRDIGELTDEAAGDLRRLANAGYRLSMDQVTELDFNLGNLARQGIQFIKIDGMKLLNIAEERAVGGVRVLKQTMDEAGIDLIAEKVESEQALVELLEFSIDFGQGYLFGEPRLSKDPPPAFVEDVQISA
ncbi:MAG: EAL domain-containing protein [Proteobacteria bacterium]|nr:EAL domain-containing protein [Pseudomonadota bacterium]